MESSILGDSTNILASIALSKRFDSITQISNSSNTEKSDSMERFISILLALQRLILKLRIPFMALFSMEIYLNIFDS